jgi:hypothetical protein
MHATWKVIGGGGNNDVGTRFGFSDILAAVPVISLMSIAAPSGNQHFYKSQNQSLFK